MPKFLVAQPPAMRTAGVAGVNVALGAGTAAVRALLAKRPVGPALLGGALGGGIMAGGMLIGDTHRVSTRLIRLQTVAMGASVSRNAGEGVPLFSRYTIPVFPLIVDVDLRSRRVREQLPLRVRVSVAGTIGVVSRLAAYDDLRVDWRESARSGYLVFSTSSPSFSRPMNCPIGYDCVRAGDYLLGTGAYAADRDAAAVRATLDHEAVHAAQHARDAVLFAVPSGEALARGSGPVGRFLNRVVVFDVLLPLGAISLVTGEASSTRHNAWYELEARTAAPGSAADFQPPP